MLTKEQRSQAIKFQDTIGGVVDAFLFGGMREDIIVECLRDEASSNLSTRLQDLRGGEAAPPQNPWARIPKQYAGRWGYDYDEKNSTFFVHCGGHRICDAEDSEVADAICRAHNTQDVGLCV